MIDLVRIEDAADIPLGAVLHNPDGIEFVYIGRELGRVGYTYFFHPVIGNRKRYTLTSTYAMWNTLVERLPDVRRFARVV